MVHSLFLQQRVLPWALMLAEVALAPVGPRVKSPGDALSTAFSLSLLSTTELQPVKHSKAKQSVFAISGIASNFVTSFHPIIYQHFLNYKGHKLGMIPNGQVIPTSTTSLGHSKSNGRNQGANSHSASLGSRAQGAQDPQIGAEKDISSRLSQKTIG